MVLSQSNMENIKDATSRMNLEQLMALREKVTADIRQMSIDLYVKPAQECQNENHDPGCGCGARHWMTTDLHKQPAPEVVGNTHPGYEITVAPNNTKEL